MQKFNHIKPLLSFALIALSYTSTYAQNINGEKIIVGKESITIINFPDKVLNINFSDDAAYEFYTPKRREDKSISIQFNKQKTEGPNTGLLVNEGGRSHMFRLVYDPTYNINDDTRPSLWYDHSDLKALKAFVAKQKEDAAKPKDEASIAVDKKRQEEQQKQEAEERKALAAAAQKQKEADAAKKAKDIEKQRKLDEEKQKQHTAELAKAKKDAEEKDKLAKLAAQKDAEAKKDAEEKAKKDAEQLAKQNSEEQKRLKELKARQEAEAKAKEQELKDLKVRQEAEAKAKEQQLKELKAKKDADALAKAQKEKQLKDKEAAEALAKAQAEKERKEKAAADAMAKAEKEAQERKNLQEQKIARQKEAEDERKKITAEQAAKKEAERIAAQERLAKLEEEKKQKEAEKAYSEVGLWQRYGKKGIDLYNFPREHVPTVISDFYIAKDTLRNFKIADSLLNEDSPNKLNIAANGVVNKGVKFFLESIAFKDIQTFYKLRIENNTDEDFLVGKTYMYWYDENEKAKQMIKSTYITYIGFFPIIKPKTVQHVVFATRSPNVLDNESLVLFVDERRKEKGGTSIVLSGAEYNKQLAKVQVSVKKGSQADEPQNEPSKKRGRRKK